MLSALLEKILTLYVMFLNLYFDKDEERYFDPNVYFLRECTRNRNCLAKTILFIKVLQIFSNITIFKQASQTSQQIESYKYIEPKTFCYYQMLSRI